MTERLIGARARELYAAKEEEGYGAKALCAGSEAEQAARMQATGRLLGLCFRDYGPHRRPKVLDIGAGFGDLKDECDARDIWYCGVEEQRWMVEIANRRHRNVHHATAMDVLDTFTDPGVKYDATVAIGVIATMDMPEASAFMQAMWAASGRFVLVSWQERSLYRGKFEAFDFDFVRGHMPAWPRYLERFETEIIAAWDKTHV